MLDVARILADQPLLEVVDGRNRRLVWPAGIGLADSVDPLVSLNLDEDMVPAQANDERLDVRDPDLRAARGWARRLSRRAASRRRPGRSS